jgi:cell division protein ZapE
VSSPERSRFDELLDGLADRPDPAAILHDFVPPTRFSDKRFENYGPMHPSQAQAAERLRGKATELATQRKRGWLASVFGTRTRPSAGGIYLDGGFGVGKTHLLAAFWHEVPEPRAYVSFDQLMYFIGIAGADAAAATFAGHRAIAVDEWELDDPGNLKMALAFLRAVLARGAFVVVTSNTLPIELGAGRFSQKDFRAEIEELASAFEVVRVDGEDFRHRHFDRDPGREYFVSPADLAARLARWPGATVYTRFEDLVRGLNRVHPIRYRDLGRRLGSLAIEEVTTLGNLPDSLRWVHFVDSIYDARVRLVATGAVRLAGIFPTGSLYGPYGKKLSRCLSRMEEMLGEGVAG